MEISYKERLQAILSKEQALYNAIVDSNFEKVHSVLKEHSEILTDKHIRLNEISKDSTTPDSISKRNDISEELNYYTEINTASFYTERNNLHLGDPTENLKAELSSKDPSHKEPIIYHIKNGADITLITKESIEQKLDDISIKNYAGYKIAEQDQSDIVRFATIHAIKSNNIEALKHLEKEFNISRELYISDNFVKHNSDLKTLNYTRGTNLREYKNVLDQPIVSEIKLQQLNANKLLEISLSRGKIEDVKKAILSGADYKLVNLQTVKHLDPKDQLGFCMAAKEASEQRKASIPSNARYEIHNEQNEILKEAVKNNDALKAYNSVKKGADISVLKQSDFKHLNKIEEKALKNELQRALNENANQAQHKNLNSSNQHTLRKD